VEFRFRESFAGVSPSRRTTPPRVGGARSVVGGEHPALSEQNLVVPIDAEFEPFDAEWPELASDALPASGPRDDQTGAPG
jgi:hypothetical protein